MAPLDRRNHVLDVGGRPLGVVEDKGGRKVKGGEVGEINEWMAVRFINQPEIK